MQYEVSIKSPWYSVSIDTNDCGFEGKINFRPTYFLINSLNQFRGLHSQLLIMKSSHGNRCFLCSTSNVKYSMLFLLAIQLSFLSQDKSVGWLVCTLYSLWKTWACTVLPKKIWVKNHITVGFSAFLCRVITCNWLK